MRISNNVQTATQLQALQPLKSQNSTEGSKTEEAVESASERAAEAQKSAAAQHTGVGINFDKSI